MSEYMNLTRLNSIISFLKYTNCGRNPKSKKLKDKGKANLDLKDRELTEYIAISILDEGHA